MIYSTIGGAFVYCPFLLIMFIVCCFLIGTIETEKLIFSAYMSILSNLVHNNSI